MKEELFNELLESVHEGGAILRDEVSPSRRSTGCAKDSGQLWAFSNRICFDARDQHGHLAELGTEKATTLGTCARFAASGNPGTLGRFGML